MKVFLVTWGLFCVLVIVGLFIAYATDQLPGVLAPQSRSEDPDKSGQVGVEAEEECSPCEENLKRLKEAMERWERERKAQAVAASNTQ
ncbi:hypothetical protein C6502_17780 [Candidatus Poribacteria bacterium]|nr:MAG: hypothetical protein C6502_17780 [Candidatus Poribacteria bacterium]